MIETDRIRCYINTEQHKTEQADNECRNQKKENLAKMPKETPVFFLAGTLDPVGSKGKGVRQSFDAFRKAGMKDLALKLYEGDRHEVLNEKDKAKVWSDVLTWLEEKRLG